MTPTTEDTTMTTMTTMDTNLRKLTDEIRQHERTLAPGSETDLWADYCEDVWDHSTPQALPYHDHEDDVTVPAHVADYWRERYAARIREASHA